MQYQYTSLKTVIGNVIRNTRVQDSSFIADIHEWLYEAMDMMETELTLEGRYEQICINFHKGKLPCGLRWIDAVEWNGHRLREGGGVRPANMDKPANYSSAGTGFITNIEKESFANHSQYTTDLVAANSLPFTTGKNDYYYTDMGTINTSFSDGTLIVYYRGVKTDDDGFPMIPDNQNYKQALYWYCRAMMIGAGWEDKAFTYSDCFEQWERIYAPRASAEIRMPSPEQMEKRINTFVRFIPHQGYYDNFFSTDRREGMFDIRKYAPNYGQSAGVAAQQPYIAGTKSETI